MLSLILALVSDHECDLMAFRSDSRDLIATKQLRTRETQLRDGVTCFPNLSVYFQQVALNFRLSLSLLRDSSSRSRCNEP